MALKSVLRRSALVTISAASAVALAACGAGQISQTANQHPAVDGSLNIGESAAGENSGDANTALGFINIRDAHILVDPDNGTAALKFSASNQQRAARSTYTLNKVSIEGLGDVALRQVAKTPMFDKAAAGEKALPRECQMVVGPESVITPLAKTAKQNDNGCIAYYTNTLAPNTLVGANSSAAGQNRSVTFDFTDPEGNNNTYKLDVTVSADILTAGTSERGADGMTAKN